MPHIEEELSWEVEKTWWGQEAVIKYRSLEARIKTFDFDVPYNEWLVKIDGEPTDNGQEYLFSTAKAQAELAFTKHMVASNTIH